MALNKALSVEGSTLNRTCLEADIKESLTVSVVKAILKS